MELLIHPGGMVRCIYAEDVDLAALGDVEIHRASHVDCDPAGAWWADLFPVDGPKLGPFHRRSQALAAEMVWLSEHLMEIGKNCNNQEEVLCEVWNSSSSP